MSPPLFDSRRISRKLINNSDLPLTKVIQGVQRSGGSWTNENFNKEEEPDE